MAKEFFKRLSVYEGVITIYFIINTFFYILNDDFLKTIPKEIAGYLFWLSFGLYLGFQLCKYEVKRILTKNAFKEKDQEKDNNMKVIK